MPASNPKRSLWGRMISGVKAFTRAVSLADETVNWRRFFGIPFRGDRGPNTRYITPNEALTVEPFFQACRIKSEAFADCVISLAERGPKGPREAKTHPAYWRLLLNPSLDHTRSEFWRLMGFWVSWRGNAFASIKRDPGTGQWLNLTPMFPDWVKPDISKETGELVWYYQQPGKGRIGPISDRDIFHLMGPSLDGRMGLDPVHLHQRVFSQALSVSDYQLDFFERGHALTGVVKFQHALDESARANWDQTLSAFQEGGNRRHGILTVEDGGDFLGVSNDPERAQLSQTDERIVHKISRITGVPLSFLMVPGSSYSTAEQEDLRLLKYCLGPLFTSSTDEVGDKLMTEPERRKYFARVNTDALDRADSLTRARVFALESNWGARLIDEWRDANGLEKIPGGDKPMRPANMVAVGVDVNPGSAPANNPAVALVDPTDAPDVLAPDALPADGAPVVADVASTGLNGAQMDSLVGIITQVMIGAIPLGTGKQLVTVAFPFLDAAAIDALFRDVKPGSLTPPNPGAKP
jgi:HK97 family phage portal protein